MNTYVTWKSYGEVATSNTMEVSTSQHRLYKKQAVQLTIFYFAFFLLNCFVGYFYSGPARFVSLFLPVVLALLIMQSVLCRVKLNTWVNACFFVMLNVEVFVINGYYVAGPLCNISCICLFLLVPKLFKSIFGKWLSIAIICINIMLIKVFYPAADEWLSWIEVSLIAGVSSGFILLYIQKIQNEKRELLMRIDSLGIQLLKANQNIDRQRKYFAETFHEVRGNFTGTFALIRGLAVYYNDERNTIQNEAFRHLGFAVKNLRGVFDNLLYYAKIEEGIPETANIELTEIQEVFTRLVSVMRHEAQRRKIKIDLQFDDDLPQVIDTDELKILKIATNLISNAVKYSKDNSTVTVEIGTLDSSWHIVVSDNGIGIPEDRYKDIFEPFVVLRSSKPNIDQMGIGLTIVERLVGVLGGKISVWSELNVGTRLTVSIPLNMSIYAEA